MKGLKLFNNLSHQDAVRVLLNCCHSKRWAKSVAEHRPYICDQDLMDYAEKVWWQLSDEDWSEAFSAHPRIGENLSDSNQFAQYSRHEQKGMAAANDEQRELMQSLNQQYEQKFGFIYLICAQGKSHLELLSELQTRLNNSRDQEWQRAAKEQMKITHLRLQEVCRCLEV